MDIHEYQAKELLAGFGVAIPRGGVAYSPEQAVYRASEIGGARWAVKAQIHSARGARPAASSSAPTKTRCARRPRRCSGKRLVTHQTGPEGRVVHRLYIEAAVPIERELYLGLVLDRKSERIMIVAHPQGGMEIEEIAEQRARLDHPREWWSRPSGMSAFQAREIAYGLGLGAGPGEPRGHDPARLLPRLPRSRRDHGGDQSAGGDDGRPGAGARLQDDLRRQRHVPPAQRERAARLRRGGSPRGPGRGVRAQLRRRSTATSAASSTAPGWPWPRWT